MPSYTRVRISVVYTGSRIFWLMAKIAEFFVRVSNNLPMLDSPHSP